MDRSAAERWHSRGPRCQRWDEARSSPSWFTDAMTDQDNSDDDTGELDEADMAVVSETQTAAVDIDGDGEADAVVETTTTVIDVDGDGVADVVRQTTTTMIDVDGDGVPDVIEQITVTGVDADGDGEFSDDEIEIDETLAVRDDLVDDTEA